MSNSGLHPNQIALNQLLQQYQQAASNSAQSVPQGQSVASILPARHRQDAGISDACAAPINLAQLLGKNQNLQVHNQFAVNGGHDQGLFQTQVQHPVEAPAPLSNGNLSQQLISSTQMLASINPELASNALAHIISMNAQQTSSQQMQLHNQHVPQAVVAQLPSHLQQRQPHISIAKEAGALTLPDVVARADAMQPPRSTNSQGTQFLPPYDSKTKTASCSRSGVNESKYNFSLEELEALAKQYTDSCQQVPQSIAVLLSTARREKAKQDAKKMANRRSAYSSRARKKLKHNAIARDNMRLKRESTILSFLPDPILVITTAGEITFCNMQMGRVLRHKVSDIIGASVENYITPSSRSELRQMIQEIIAAEKLVDDDTVDGSGSGSSANVISLRSSDQSLPMTGLEQESDISSDPSTKKSFNIQESHTNEDDTGANVKLKTGSLQDSAQMNSSESKLPSTSEASRCQSSSSNSSLGKKSSSSGSSDYSSTNKGSHDKESNGKTASSMSNADEREDGNIPMEVERAPPLAPACNVSLVPQGDLTIYCEVTCSIRTLTETDDDFAAATSVRKQITLKQDEPSCANKSMIEVEIGESEIKEILLCFRPIAIDEKPKEEEPSEPEERSSPLKKRKFRGGDGDIEARVSKTRLSLSSDQAGAGVDSTNEAQQ